MTQNKRFKIKKKPENEQVIALGAAAPTTETRDDEISLPSVIMLPGSVDFGKTSQ